MNIKSLLEKYFCFCKDKEEKIHPFPLKVSKNPYNY
jgi:hypothetical protein